MSADEHLELDCADCLGHLYEYVDGELTPELAAAISAHLEDCGECLPHFKFEQAYLAFLKARPQLASAPRELRDQILRRLLSEKGPSA